MKKLALVLPLLIATPAFATPNAKIISGSYSCEWVGDPGTAANFSSIAIASWA